MPYYTYILAKARNSTFYVGVSNDIVRRVYEHKQGMADGFTKKYGIKMLVYYEIHEEIEAAIAREKSIKRWTRAKKMAAIEGQNPHWDDLYEGLVNPDPGVSETENRDDNVSMAQRSLTQRLQQAGIDSAAGDAKRLLLHALGCDAAALVRDSQRVLSADELTTIETLAQRRLNREPMSHILGYKDFWQDRFMVTADVLTPRADSETLIEAMLAHQPNRDAAYTIADLGTGSGALLLSLLREYPNARGTGIDRSEAALKVAQANAKALGLANRADFLLSNWMQTLQTQYDMIITNPPYIERCVIETLEPEVKVYEPYMALTGGDDGLDAYRQILQQAPSRMKVGAWLVLELGIGQAAPVAELAALAELKVREVREDLGGIKRALVCQKP